jgi:ABC-type nitrate/sulfonate/bicarbonate transport system permease component
VGVAVIVAIWWGGSRLIGHVRLPTPPVVISAGYNMLRFDPRLASNPGMGSTIVYPLWFTTEHAMIGLVVGSLVGIALGAWLGWSETVRLVVEWPLEMLRVAPPLIAAPFLLFWFGIGALAQFLLVGMYAAFVITIGTFTAIKNMAPVYAAFAGTLGASRSRIYARIVLPAIVPELIGPLRVANALAWGLEIVAELLGAQNGMGRVFDIYLGYFYTQGTIAGILWLSFLAVVSDRVLYGILRFATRWKPVLTELRAV